MQGQPLVVYPEDPDSVEFTRSTGFNAGHFHVFYSNPDFGRFGGEGVQLMIKRPFMVDADFNAEGDIPYDVRDRRGVITRRYGFTHLVEEAQARRGCDGVIIQNLSRWPEGDEFSEESNVYIVFDLEQVIPLESPRANRSPRAPRRNGEPQRATLFDSRMRLLGHCQDTPNAIAKAFMEVPAAAFVDTQGEGDYDPQPGVRSREDYEGSMNAWNDAESGFMRLVRDSRQAALEGPPKRIQQMRRR
jgi:hypothetical protein